MTAFSNSDSSRTVKIYGQPNSPAAYEIRDFLSRSSVEFDWFELTCDEDCQSQLGLPKLSEVRLPVVEFPDGYQLFAPTLEEIAQRLGWVTKPKFKEYDLSIYGAGPAGLSAAVYAASEGLRTILIERQAIGGQAGTSSLIENYMGFPDGISGADLAARAHQQAVKFGIEVLLLREGVKAEFKDNRIYADMADGSQMIARANICATGVELEFRQKMLRERSALEPDRSIDEAEETQLTSVVYEQCYQPQNISQARLLHPGQRSG